MNHFESLVRTSKSAFGITSASRILTPIRPAYDMLLSLFYGRRGLERVINNEETIRVKPAHRYAQENYESAVFSYLKKNVREGSVVLEVGAHVGVFTILLARWAGVKGHVYAFEPAPVARTALQLHLRLNDVYDRVSIIASAVSDHCGTARFFTSKSSPENTLSSIHSRIPAADEIEVPVTTIDEFCSLHKLVPSLLKIDIEGFELHALRGAQMTLAANRLAVVVELHPMNWPEIGVTQDDVRKFLDELGYRPVSLEGQTNTFIEYGHIALEKAR